MKKWRLKGCPRCGGDILVERDEYGWDEHCLQCGYRQDLKNLAEIQEPVRVREQQPASVGQELS